MAKKASANNNNKAITEIDVKDLDGLKQSYTNFVNQHKDLQEKLKFVYKDERERFRDEIIYNAIDDIYEFLTKIDIPVPPPPTSEVKIDYKVIDSSKDDGNKAENVNDGKVDTRFSSKTDNNYILLEKTDKTNPKTIGIAWYKGNERTNEFVVEASPDKKNWTLVESAVSSGATNGMEKYEFNTVVPNTQYVKVIGKGNSQNNGWFSITEIELYGEDSEDNKPPTEPPIKPPEPPEPPVKPTEPGKPDEGKEGATIEGIKIPYKPTSRKIRVDDYYYNENNGLRLDFQDNPKDGAFVNSVCVVYGKFVNDPTSNEERGFKYSQAPHSDDGDIVNTYITAIENGDGSTRVRFEEDHPSGYRTLAEGDTGTGVKKGQTWGMMGIRQNVLDKKGKIKGVLLELWEDRGIEGDKPGSKWVRLIRYLDTKLLITDYSEHGMEVTCRMDDKKGDKNIKIQKAFLAEIPPLQEK